MELLWQAPIGGGQRGLFGRARHARAAALRDVAGKDLRDVIPNEQLVDVLALRKFRLERHDRIDGLLGAVDLSTRFREAAQELLVALEDRLEVLFGRLLRVEGDDDWIPGREVVDGDLARTDFDPTEVRLEELSVLLKSRRFVRFGEFGLDPLEASLGGLALLLEGSLQASATLVRAPFADLLRITGLDRLQQIDSLLAFKAILAAGRRVPTRVDPGLPDDELRARFGEGTQHLDQPVLRVEQVEIAATSEDREQQRVLAFLRREAKSQLSVATAERHPLESRARKMRAEVRAERRETLRCLGHPAEQTDPGQLGPRIDPEGDLALAVFVAAVDRKREPTAIGLDPTLDPSPGERRLERRRDAFELDETQHSTSVAPARTGIARNSDSNAGRSRAA